jgi:hypothetical protein
VSFRWNRTIAIPRKFDPATGLFEPKQPTVPKGKPATVRLVHRTKKGTGDFNALDLVPCTWKPRPNAKQCPTCHVKHPYKTLHLWIEPDGSVLVAWVVYQTLLRAGLPNYDVAADVVKAPPLKLGQDVTRLEVDKQNRKMTMWKPWKRTLKKEAVSV